MDFEYADVTISDPVFPGLEKSTWHIEKNDFAHAQQAKCLSKALGNRGYPDTSGQ